MTMRAQRSELAGYHFEVQRATDAVRPLAYPLCPLLVNPHPYRFVALMVAHLTTEKVRRGIEDDRNRTRLREWERKRGAPPRAGGAI